MANWFKSLFRKEHETYQSDQLQRDTQSLRSMLEDQDKVIAQLTRELQKLRSESEIRAQKSTQVLIEKFIADVSSSITKLNSQIFVVEEQNRPLNVREVLAVAKQFITIFQKYGLRLEGYVGEITPFNPDHHSSLSKDVPIDQEEPVVVRFVGVAYRGKLLRKAGVEVCRSLSSQPLGKLTLS